MKPSRRRRIVKSKIGEPEAGGGIPFRPPQSRAGLVKSSEDPEEIIKEFVTEVVRTLCLPHI